MGCADAGAGATRGDAAAATGPRQSSLHESSLSASLMFVKNDVSAFIITPEQTKHSLTTLFNYTLLLSIIKAFIA